MICGNFVVGGGFFDRNRFTRIVCISLSCSARKGDTIKEMDGPKPRSFLAHPVAPEDRRMIRHIVGVVSFMTFFVVMGGWIISPMTIDITEKTIIWAACSLAIGIGAWLELDIVALHKSIDWACDLVGAPHEDHRSGWRFRS